MSTSPAEEARRLLLDVEIVLAMSALAKRRFTMARRFRDLAIKYVEKTREALDEGEAALRRLAAECRPDLDEFDLLLPELLDQLEARDSRGAK